MKRVIALALMLLGAAPALGDEFVCTGDLIYNPYNNAFMVQDAKGPFRSMIRITRSIPRPAGTRSTGSIRPTRCWPRGR